MSEKLAEFEQLLLKLKNYPRVIIQAHDFPDHDAISSAYALGYLLGEMDFKVELVYVGLIDRISIHRMIAAMAIPIKPVRECDLTQDDVIIMVDGCKGEKNVTDIIGDEIAVIDHHHVNPPDDLWYFDVRPEYGSTATIIVEYFNYFKIPIPKGVATALQIGLNVDTASLTRGFCAADIAVFSQLHTLADQNRVNRICRNSLEAEELIYFQTMLNSVTIHENIAVAVLPTDCPKNFLGILGDFLITVDTVDITILACEKDDAIQLSMRSEIQSVDMAEITRSVLTSMGIGYGGGHPHMAGGIVYKDKLSNIENPCDDIFQWFLSEIWLQR